MPIRLYGRYKRAGDSKVSVHAKIGEQALDRAVTVRLPDRDNDNPEIERMWAWHRIDRLLKEADANGSRTSVLDEVIRLGEGYSIVSEYTSFIVLENDAEYQRWRIERRNVERFARDRQSQERLAEQLRQLRDKATASLGPEAVGTADVEPKVATPMNRQQASAAPMTPRLDGRSQDLGWPAAPGAKGGGAIDPLTALAAGALLLAAAAARRARHA
jgi:hypothetical protein